MPSKASHGFLGPACRVAAERSCREEQSNAVAKDKDALMTMTGTCQLRAEDLARRTNGLMHQISVTRSALQFQLLLRKDALLT